MKRLAVVLVAAMMVVMSVPGEAGAWLKFKNSTPNMIWTAHAFASTSGFLCGYNDGCSGSRGEWRVQGWWAIAPGGTATVQSNTYGNAWHDYYAEDSFGHVWKNGGGTYCSDQTAFDRCDQDLCIGCMGNCPNPNPSLLQYRRLRSTRCCGGTCQSDYTLNFVL